MYFKMETNYLVWELANLLVTFYSPMTIATLTLTRIVCVLRLGTLGLVSSASVFKIE